MLSSSQRFGLTLVNMSTAATGKGAGNGARLDPMTMPVIELTKFYSSDRRRMDPAFERSMDKLSSSLEAFDASAKASSASLRASIKSLQKEVHSLSTGVKAIYATAFVIGTGATIFSNSGLIKEMYNQAAPAVSAV